MSGATWSGLADGHHLRHALLLEGDLHGGGGAVLGVRHVAVGAHLVGHQLGALRADRPRDLLALLHLHHLLHLQLNLLAHLTQLIELLTHF